MGLTNIILEVEGISEVEATYPSHVFSVGLFWTDSMWVSFLSVSHSICNCASNNFSSRFVILMSIVLLSVLSLFSTCTCCWRVSLSFKNFR